MNREQWQIKRCHHDAVPQSVHGMTGAGYPVGIFEITVDSHLGLASANDAEDEGAIVQPIMGRDDAGSCCDWSRPEMTPT